MGEFGISVTIWRCGLGRHHLCPDLPASSSLRNLFALLTAALMSSLADWELTVYTKFLPPHCGQLRLFICLSSISIWGTPFSKRRQALNAVSDHTSSKPEFPKRLLFCSCHSKTGTCVSVHLVINSVCLPIYFVHDLCGQAGYGSINS